LPARQRSATLRGMHLMDSYLGWTVDFANPRGAPAFTAPDSISWRIYKNPVALAVGGVAAVLLEFAEPRIRTGVWTHSDYKSDPAGRSMRTGMAAMVGVYAPKDVALRIIQGVNNMHARVEGKTPAGEPYNALDPELLDWVSATASYGFLTAYDRFVAPLGAAEKAAFYAESEPIARLYGVSNVVTSDEDFMAMLDALAPRFEPHPIVHEFLTIFASGPGALGLPRRVRRLIVRAAVSLVPDQVRETLAIDGAFQPTRLSLAMARVMGAIAERTPLVQAPPAQACVRLGLPADFLYRSRANQARLLARRFL
jgi:uncharacterized protein (DUF2236 family)